MKKYFKFLLIIVLILLVSACEGSGGSKNETGNIRNVQVSKTEPIKTIVGKEEFPLPNCGGSGELTQSLGTQASIQQSVRIGAKATVRGGGEVTVPAGPKAKLELEVELAYEQAYANANARLDTIQMKAAAGTHVIYETQWEEQKFSSMVSYEEDGKTLEVPYTYVLRVPKISDSSQKDCPSGSESVQISPTAPTIEQVTPTLDEREKAAQTLGYEDLDVFMASFEIPTEVKSRISVCPNGEEGWCLTVWEEQGQADFHFRNITKCNLDGKQANGVNSIPIGFDGTVRGFTVRPCSTDAISEYYFVSLSNVGIPESGNLGLEAGAHNLADVDFDIGWIATTHSEGDPNNQKTIVLTPQQNIYGSKVHFLLQASWSEGEKNDTDFGTVGIVFSDGSTVTESLRPGYNLRDWSQVGLSLPASNVQQAHEGTAWDGKTKGVVDKLTIDIPSNYQNLSIQRIEIRDESMERLNSPNPGIHLWAVTIEK